MLYTFGITIYKCGMNTPFTYILNIGATMGNIINAGYKLMVQVKPDAVLVLGDIPRSGSEEDCRDGEDPYRGIPGYQRSG